MLQFRYPLEPRPRIAVYGIVAGEARLHEAETVAAPACLLVELDAPGWEPLFPVVAFTGPTFGFLTEADRESLWRRWKVPIFEQLLSARMDLIAEECEAHDGLHLCVATWALQGGRLLLDGLPTGISAEMVTERCGCGLSAPRLKTVGPAIAEVHSAARPASA